MNMNDMHEMKYLLLDLKFCEGCGALWLRRSIDGVYCAACVRHLAEYPTVRLKHQGGRPRSQAAVTPRSRQRRCHQHRCNGRAQ
jgi:hypothetical protein